MDIATLGIAVRSDQVEKASDALGRLSDQAAKAQGTTDRLRDANGRFVKSGNEAAAANDNVAGSARRAALGYQTLGAAARVAMGALSAIAGALATGALIQYADAWSDMQSRVGAAVRDMDAAPALMQRMVDIANASYSPLDQTVEVYSRNVAVLQDLGRGAAEAADFTEALNHALVLTATRGERAASVQNALSKAMAVGRLQADGLETVLANGGEVAQVLADQLGTTVSGLRQMATDGKITGDVIATALITRLEDLRDRAGEMPATVGDAFVRLRTNLTAFIGGLDQSTGSSQRLAGAIMLLADNIDNIARVAAVAGVALLTAFAPAILAAMGAGLVALGAAGVAAMNAITVAVMANPLGALAVFVATALTAIFLFRDEIEDIFGVDIVGYIEAAVNTYIGLWVGAYQAIVAEWRNFPAALGDLAAQAGQALNNVMADALNKAVQQIRDFIAWVNPITAAAKLAGFDVGSMMATPSFTPQQVANPNAGAAAATGSNIAGIMSDAMGQKYISFTREAAETSRSAAEAIGEMNSAMGEVSGGDAGGGSAGAAGQAVRGFTSDIDRAAEASARFIQDTAKGFMNDLRSGLEQGKGFFQSFADAAVNALNKIIDKLMDQAFSGFFGGGGGFLGSLFGGGFPTAPGGVAGTFFGGGLYQSGGWTGNGAVGAAAGVVHGQEFVVRAGPAAQHRQLLEAINSGRPVSANNNVPAAANGNGGHSVVELRMSPDVEARILETSGSQTVRIVQANDKARSNQYANGGQFG